MDRRATTGGVEVVDLPEKSFSLCRPTTRSLEPRILLCVWRRWQKGRKGPGIGDQVPDQWGGGIVSLKEWRKGKIHNPGWPSRAPGRNPIIRKAREEGYMGEFPGKKGTPFFINFRYAGNLNATYDLTSRTEEMGCAHMVVGIPFTTTTLVSG